MRDPPRAVPPSGIDGSPHLQGRTSLSKAWGLIDRFSKDIDLTIERNILGFGDADAPEAAKSKSERQRRLDRLKQACRDMITQAALPKPAWANDYHIVRARQGVFPLERRSQDWYREVAA